MIAAAAVTAGFTLCALSLLGMWIQRNDPRESGLAALLFFIGLFLVLAGCVL